MEKKKTGALNLGAKGFVVVILAFLSCYCTQPSRPIH